MQQKPRNKRKYAAKTKSQNMKKYAAKTPKYAKICSLKFLFYRNVCSRIQIQVNGY